MEYFLIIICSIYDILVSVQFILEHEGCVFLCFQLFCRYDGPRQWAVLLIVFMSPACSMKLCALLTSRGTMVVATTARQRTALAPLPLSPFEWTSIVSYHLPVSQEQTYTCVHTHSHTHTEQTVFTISPSPI